MVTGLEMKDTEDIVSFIPDIHGMFKHKEPLLPGQ